MTDTETPKRKKPEEPATLTGVVTWARRRYALLDDSPVVLVFDDLAPEAGTVVEVRCAPSRQSGPAERRRQVLEVVSATAPEPESDPVVDETPAPKPRRARARKAPAS